MSSSSINEKQYQSDVGFRAASSVIEQGAGKLSGAVLRSTNAPYQP
ncbi:hypothetical protein RESH_05432 [Rhodopirellula europaea SH398]|uniref:Uncharacterized protein n=1 Tax=Rhodopirellula europaea SH398 TaxID=1263868 RepID=M5RXQ2_9BACT|nr:hypothetical protein RESH_05432 [Rhodopirellula europaea SH398]